MDISIADDEYDDMAPEERRRWNIERNNQYLSSLFSPGERGLLSVQETSSLPSSRVIDHIQVEEKPSELFRKISSDVPSRHSELLRILEYLEKGFFPAPALTVYGPAGSGKTFLCDICLQSVLSSPVVSVNCREYSSQRNLVSDIWEKSIRAINSFNTRCFDYTPSASLGKEKGAAYFSDMTGRLHTILELQRCFFSKVEACTKIPGLILLLDHIDCIDELEAGLTHRLLRLRDLCHPMLKVIATCRSPPRLGDISCLLLRFGAYTDSDFMPILTHRFGSAHMAATDSEKEEFTGLVRQCLPGTLLRTRCVEEVWAVLSAVWERRSRAQTQPEAELRTVLSQPAPHMIAPIAGQKRDRNTAIARLDDATLLTKDWYVDIPHRRKVVLLAAFLASRNPQETDRTTFGTALKGRRKKVRAGGGDEGRGSDIYEQKLLPRTFGLERLLAIYRQILPATQQHESMGEIIGTEDTEECDMLTYATINSLIRSRFLVSRAPGAGHRAGCGDSNTPLLFLCTLQAECAEVLARSISFPLRDYLCT